MLSLKVISAFNQHRLVSTDSRKIPEGAVFFALSGENFDGNRYAGKALDAGASYAVVSDPGLVPSGDDRYILVEDVLKCLQELALWYRRTFSIPVLGITGTNGKTTTKELVHAAISSDRKVHATSGNLNNHIGVPLTLLSMPSDTAFAIIEMGANKPGDIQELAEIAEPTHALITNIGQAHLERFGDVEGVRRTKGELFDFIRASGGIAFVNLRDLRVVSVANGITRQITYGNSEADYHVKALQNHADHLDLTMHFKNSGIDHEFRANLIGPHNAENVLAAVVVADSFGVPIASIRTGLAAYFPKLNRTELIQGPGFTVLLDAYNANPSSMQATLNGIHGRPHGRMALILGDMFELGPDSPRFHNEIVLLAQNLFPEAMLVGVGKEMKGATTAMGHGGGFNSIDEAEREIMGLLEGVDFVLIKGSRGMALERLLPAMGVSRDGQAH